ncbi:unnamed protein product [Paramecium pentaurelia]|uniref:Uncharacterized protein n=1 Tax=Paramecium pentaurelia TaxID=43138 RepID=A0A8S1T9R1_9CILI|nr:unnamed protein product [Paramecium pentaurelia]
MYNNQTVQLVGRLSPKTKINLEQQNLHKLSNKMLAKHINPDIALVPMLDDIIPFSEILNQRKMLQSVQPIQYYEEQRPSRTIFTTQPKSQTHKSSRSIKSNSTHRDQKSRMSNQKYELMSCCSCSCCGCSRKSSTRLKKSPTPTPKVRRNYQENPSTNKSNKSIKQSSIASSESKKVRKQKILNSSQQTKQKCEYHHYEHRQSHLTTHQSNRKPRPSSAAMINPETARKQKLKEYQEKQKLLQNLYSAKQLQPQPREQSLSKVAWRADISRIEEGKLRKSRIEKIVQVQKEILNKSLSRHRSASKQESKKIVPPPDPQKLKLLDQRKKLMEKKDQKIIHDKKEAQRLKQVLNQLKKQKQEEKELKNKKTEQLSKLEKYQKENRLQCKKKRFEPTEQQIEQAFQIISSDKIDNEQSIK